MDVLLLCGSWRHSLTVCSSVSYKPTRGSSRLIKDGCLFYIFMARARKRERGVVNSGSIIYSTRFFLCLFQRKTWKHFWPATNLLVWSLWTLMVEESVCWHGVLLLVRREEMWWCMFNVIQILVLTPPRGIQLMYERLSGRRRSCCVGGDKTITFPRKMCWCWRNTRSSVWVLIWTEIRNAVLKVFIHHQDTQGRRTVKCRLKI